MLLHLEWSYVVFVHTVSFAQTHMYHFVLPSQHCTCQGINNGNIKHFILSGPRGDGLADGSHVGAGGHGGNVAREGAARTTAAAARSCHQGGTHSRKVKRYNPTTTILNAEIQMWYYYRDDYKTPWWCYVYFLPKSVVKKTSMEIGGLSNPSKRNAHVFAQNSDTSIEKCFCSSFFVFFYGCKA